MNCTKYFENESNFSKPMPWIGLYVAAASLLCGLAMLADLVNGFWHHQRWIPSRYFKLNATSLTIIAVAIKFSVDLSTPMPGKTDQVAKISTSVLICVIMGILTTSLGKMKDTELLSNLIALVIVVATSIVNLPIQLKTGVIYAHRGGHIFLLVSMVYLLMVYCSTAIALASIKNELRVQYENKHQLAVNEFMNGSSGETMTKRLEDYLMKFSMMSHTGWPHFVLGRSVSCVTAWSLCLAGVMFLGIAMIMPDENTLYKTVIIYCNGKSDYEWSTSLVLVTQLFAVVVGSTTLIVKRLIAPMEVFHMQMQLWLSFSPKVERHWIQLLVEIKKRPFFWYIHSRTCRKFVHFVKNSFCNILITIQVAVVIVSEALGTFNEYFTFGRCAFVLLPFRWLSRFFRRNHPHSTYPYRRNQTELKQYVLFLKGEEKLIDSMMKIALNVTSQYIVAGKRKAPNNLIQFLEKSLSHDFEGVFRFESIQVPPLGSEEPPPNCWSLSVVTLTSIAVLLPNIDPCKVDELLKAVGEGLMFVKVIEKNLNKNFYLNNARKAADFVWEEVDIHHRRFDIEQSKLAVQGNNPITILEFLVDSAKKKFLAFKPSDGASIWPIEAEASYSLYKICQTILLDCQNRSFHQTVDDMFKMLSLTVCDILGACLTNLKRSISKECSRSTIENMHETARRVLILFGRAETIMELLNGKVIPQLDCKKLAFIDGWQHSAET